MKKAIILIILLSLCSISFADLSPDRFDPFLGTLWYGIYMQDMKMGYAKISIDRTGDQSWQYETELLMKLNTGQGDIELKSIESRIYNGDKAEIVANKYISESGLGSIIINGKQGTENYSFEIDIMGNKQNQVLDYPPESLDDYLTLQMRAHDGELANGDKIEQEVFVFDPSILDRIKHIATLTGKETIPLFGVPTEVYTFIDSIPSMHIGGKNSIDMNGNLIYQEYPSMGIVMKLESESVAKDINEGYDILAASIIKTPSGPADPKLVTEAKYRISGYNSEFLPENKWTKIEPSQNDTFKITVISPIDKFDPTDNNMPAIPKELTRYLDSDHLIQSDAEEIVSLADEILQDKSTGFAAACKINRWVYSNINKQFSPDISNAVQTLKLKRGDCGEHAALTVALLRAAGIPARIAAGVAYAPYLEGFGYHAWVEVYIGEWIQMDPTWGEDIADAAHIMLASGSLDKQATAIMGSMTTLRVEILDYKQID